jgi:hypothetical protein
MPLAFASLSPSILSKLEDRRREARESQQQMTAHRKSCDPEQSSQHNHSSFRAPSGPITIFLFVRRQLLYFEMGSPLQWEEGCGNCGSGLVWTALVWSGLVWSGLVWTGLINCWLAFPEQSFLVSGPIGSHDHIFLPHDPDLITTGQVLSCNFLLAFACRLTFGFEPRGTHDLIFFSRGYPYKE